jgi:arylsulfatase A-like enzyme
MPRPTPKLTLVVTLVLGFLAFTAATATRTSAAFASARAGSPPVASSGTARMNVVFIVSDDERVDGNAVMKDVQRLVAKHGVTFTNFHVTTSECGPSRASILTGLYGHHSGFTDNFGHQSYPEFHTNSNLAVWLHRAGYETGLVGKYLNDYTLYGHHVVPPGWDDWRR